jgi:hypothetical protein
MGHGSAAFTLTDCGHLFDADIDALAGALDVSDAGRTRDSLRRTSDARIAAITCAFAPGVGLEPRTYGSTVRCELFAGVHPSAFPPAVRPGQTAFPSAAG